MNNYREIQNQWDMADQARYPHLFNRIVEMMRKGIEMGEVVMK